MSERYYRFSTGVSRWVGAWFFRIGAWFVAAGYYLFFPKRVAVSVRFYRKLFPDRSGIYAFLAAWRQYQSFTTVFLDRFLLERDGHIPYTSRGWEHLEGAIEKKTGGVILMSHMGNWEVAAHLLKKRGGDIPLMLFMGARGKEQIERMQKDELTKSGVRIIAADETGGSPFDMIEGIRFLQGGGLVSLTGDLVRHERQRTVMVDFLGEQVQIPEMPHVLALVSGAPLFVLFACRSGKGRYAFSVTPPIYVRAADRTEKEAAIRASGQMYAALLEEKLREHPFQWYHFRPFLPRNPS